MNLVETIAVTAFAANMSALSWIMATLFKMRQEISDKHGRHDTELQNIDKRVLRLERLWE